MSILETHALKKYYAKGNIQVKAVDGIDLTVEKGEFISIIGASGSGKSTFLNLLGGLGIPSSGTILIDGQDISELDEYNKTIFRRRKIGFVFQDFNLLPMLNVYDNIILPLELDNAPIDKKYFKQIINQLSLTENLYSMPEQLSGGQQQRVAIARALITKPTIILADEPTGNLDSENSMAVLQLLKTANKLYHQTIIMITHNKELALATNRIIKICDGKLNNSYYNENLNIRN
ncbi:MAG: ABC transporter ATP-binding protein [Clostridium sp.]|nr:ABC transporter ATP-binding protein [Clostridium sp.]